MAGSFRGFSRKEKRVERERERLEIEKDNGVASKLILIFANSQMESLAGYHVCFMIAHVSPGGHIVHRGLMLTDREKLTLLLDPFLSGRHWKMSYGETGRVGEAVRSFPGEAVLVV